MSDYLPLYEGIRNDTWFTLCANNQYLLCLTALDEMVTFQPIVTALVARQIWQILGDPSSVIIRVQAAGSGKVLADRDNGTVVLADNSGAGYLWTALESPASGLRIAAADGSGTLQPAIDTTTGVAQAAVGDGVDLTMEFAGVIRDDAFYYVGHTRDLFALTVVPMLTFTSQYPEFLPELGPTNPDPTTTPAAFTPSVTSTSSSTSTSTLGSTSTSSTSTTPSPTATSPQPQTTPLSSPASLAPSKPNTGLIAGLTVGIASLLILLLALVCFLRKRRSRARTRASDELDGVTSVDAASEKRDRGFQSGVSELDAGAIAELEARHTAEADAFTAAELDASHSAALGTKGAAVSNANDAIKFSCDGVDTLIEADKNEDAAELDAVGTARVVNGGSA